MNPLIVIEGARIEIDGEEILVIIVPTKWESKEQMRAFQEQFYSFGFQIFLVNRQPDGTLRASGWRPLREKIQTRIDAGIQWTKIPIYPH